MEKFLVETECANLTEHHLFWCSKCNANKVDSLEHTSGRFFCISGQEFTGTVGEPRQVVFALCPTCLSTNMWGPTEEFKPKTNKIEHLDWAQVQDSPLFKVAFKRRDLKACIHMASALMNCSLEDAEELVVMLLEEQN